MTGPDIPDEKNSTINDTDKLMSANVGIGHQLKMNAPAVAVLTKTHDCVNSQGAINLKIEVVQHILQKRFYLSRW